MRQYLITACVGLATIAVVALVIGRLAGLESLPTVSAILAAAAALALLFAFAFWAQLMVRYNVRVYGIVTRYLRPGETLGPLEYIALLVLPLRDPARLADRVMPQGAAQLAACSLERRRIWLAVAVCLVTALVLWLAQA